MTTTYDPKLYKIVPIDPTYEMIEAGNKEPFPIVHSIYLAMLTAAPEITLNPWQDISEAPKDGTRIWVNTNKSSDASSGRRVWWNSSKKSWLVAANRRLRYEPTHWMPLPTPPEN